MSPLDNVRVYEFSKVSDPRGNLSFIEEGCHVPFSIKRVFHIYDVPGGETRGGHAHKKNIEVVMAVSGSFDMCLTDGDREVIVRLDRANKGVLVPTGVWITMRNFTTGTVLAALCSDYYDADDYIRDFDLYKEYVAQLKTSILKNDDPTPAETL